MIHRTLNNSLKTYSFLFMLTVMLLTECCIYEANAILFDLQVEPDAIFTLSDRNSFARLELNPDLVIFPGMGIWKVDGIDDVGVKVNMFKTGLPGFSGFIEVLRFVDAQQLSDSVLFLRYGTPNTFYVDVTYSLSGGAPGSGRSRLSEKFTITNNTGTPVDFQFYKFTDFDLPFGLNTARIVNGNRAEQSSSEIFAQERVRTPFPSFFEVSFFEDRLEDQDIDTNLNNYAGPLTGDVSWGFQWNRILNPSESFSISTRTDIKPVPEPSALSLVGFGLSVLILMRKRFKR